MFLAATTMPKVIPMHISGFDKVMPEPRGFPACELRSAKAPRATSLADHSHYPSPAVLPRPVPRGTLEVNIGEPLDAVLKPSEVASRRSAKADSD
jgi:hypothetical protein